MNTSRCLAGMFVALALMAPAATAVADADAGALPVEATSSARTRWESAIASQVGTHWRPPSDLRDGRRIRVRIDMTPDAEVECAHVETSSGDASFDSSVLKAINVAGRLPMPAEAADFEQTVVIGFQREPAGPLTAVP